MFTINKELTLKVRNYFFYGMPLWFYLILAQGLRRSHGHLRLAHLIYFTVALLLFTFYWINNKLESTKTIPKNFLFVLVGVFCFELYNDLHLIYAEKSILTLGLKVLFGFAGVLSLINLFPKVNGFIKPFYNSYFIAVGVLALILVPIISPEPIIDVWFYQEKAADLLINLKNPYLIEFPDLYNGKYDSTHGYPYWPMILYVTTLGKLLFSDVRYGSIVFFLLFVFHFLKNDERKNPLLICAWLFFPVQYFVLEQSWVEVILIPLVYFHLFFLKKERFWASAIILGLICATKQTMVFYAILSSFYCIKRASFKMVFGLSLVTFITLLGLFLPFLISGHEEFIKETITDVLRLTPRSDSLSWSSYLLHFYGFSLSGFIYLPLVLIALSFSAFKILNKESTIGDLLISLVATYMIVFLFGKQAFCNYYFLVAFFLFLLIREKIDFGDGDKIET